MQFLEPVEAIGVTVTGVTYVRPATFVVRGAEQENSIVRVIHADRTCNLIQYFVKSIRI